MTNGNTIEKRTGRNAVPMELVEKRRAFVGRLKTQGFSINDIISQVNTKDEDEHWGTISRTTYHKDVKEFFRMKTQRSTREEMEIAEAETISQIEFYTEQRANMLKMLYNDKINQNAWLKATPQQRKNLKKPLSNLDIAVFHSRIIEYSERIDKLRGVDKGTSINAVIGNTFNNQNNFYERASEGTTEGESGRIATRLAGLIREAVRDSGEVQQEDGLVKPGRLLGESSKEVEATSS